MSWLLATKNASTEAEKKILRPLLVDDDSKILQEEMLYL